MQQIDVAVFDEHEIFRRGAVACLAADPLLRVVVADAEPQPVEVDVAVVSSLVVTTCPPPAALVVCAGPEVPPGAMAGQERVHAVLPRASVSADQLVSAVRAAAVGLQIQRPPLQSANLDTRSIDVLHMLAEGAATREISQRLGYSERTIKGIIHEIHLGLGARSRAHAVATALRANLI